jgi:hypothetical protein
MLLTMHALARPVQLRLSVQPQPARQASPRFIGMRLVPPGRKVQLERLGRWSGGAEGATLGLPDHKVQKGHKAQQERLGAV